LQRFYEFDLWNQYFRLDIQIGVQEAGIFCGVYALYMQYRKLEGVNMQLIFVGLVAWFVGVARDAQAVGA
jgi:hypothetical protein